MVGLFASYIWFWVLSWLNDHCHCFDLVLVDALGYWLVEHHPFQEKTEYDRENWSLGRDGVRAFLPYHSCWFLTVVVIWCYYVIILVSSTAHWIGHFESNIIASIMTIVVIVHLIEIKHVHVKLCDILLPSHQTHQLVYHLSHLSLHRRNKKI